MLGLFNMIEDLYLVESRLRVAKRQLEELWLEKSKSDSELLSAAIKLNQLKSLHNRLVSSKNNLV